VTARPIQALPLAIVLHVRALLFAASELLRTRVQSRKLRHGGGGRGGDEGCLCAVQHKLWDFLSVVFRVGKDPWTGKRCIISYLGR